VTSWSSGRDTRNLRAAFQPSALFLGLVAVFAVSGWMAWTGFGAAQVDVILFVVSGWLVSLCLHEYGHALIAYRSGDLGVAERGYLTLNPLRYTNVLMSIVFPLVFLFLGGIGLPGGAVWIDHSHIRNRLRESVISLAGPLVNLAFLLVTVAPFALGVDTFTHQVFWAGLAFLAFLQLTATLLNLAPIPGVDGGNALRPWLSGEYRRGFDLVAPWGMILLFALLMSPVINGFFFRLVYDFGDFIGLPGYLADQGRSLFQFWR
jgi:Zn-dependent protease